MSDATPDPDETPIAALARRRPAAYNARHLEAFAALYHDDVVVFRGEEVSLRGRDALREGYRAMFERWEYGAAVPQRMSAGRHCVDYEHFWRVNPETGERTEGTILVRFTERDGLIGVVQFLT